MSDVKLTSGVMYTTKKGKRVGIASLEDAMTEMAKCQECGINCCENALYLRDQITGAKTKITVENGVLVSVPVSEL